MCNIGSQKGRATVRHIPKSKAIVAYRYWRVFRPLGPGMPKLQSVHRDTMWGRGDQTADQPVRLQQGFFDSNGKAGFYAYRSKTAALRDRRTLPEGATFVLGTVELWGDVVEHQRGFRAQRVRVRSLDRVARSVYSQTKYRYEFRRASAADMAALDTLRFNYRAPKSAA